MTTLDDRPAQVAAAERPKTLVQQLASAYAERLSYLRCDATPVELAENARLIADLEARYRGERPAVDEPAGPASVDLREHTDAPRTVWKLDPTVYLG